MKIKYELHHDFKFTKCLTVCPHGYINRDDDLVMVRSVQCVNKCNFYKRKRLFKQEIICNYDKYHKKGK